MPLALPSTPKSWLATLAVVLGIGVALYALFARKSDEELIREQLDRLAHVVAVDGDENVVFRRKRMHDHFPELFTPFVRVDIPELSGLTSGRDDLELLATRAGTYFRRAEVDVQAEQIDLVAGSASATVRGSATISGERGHGAERDERRVTFGLAKVDGKWLIDSVTVAPKREGTAPIMP